MSEPAPVPADQEEALRDRYTVVYEGDPDGMKILSGEPAPGRAVTVIVGDQWEEVATLRAERDAAEKKQVEDRAWYEMTVSVVEEQRDNYRDDVLRLHREKMDRLDRALVAEANLIALAKMYGEACSELQVLRALAHDVAAEAEGLEPHDYEVIGTTYDGVKVLRAISEPTNFTREEIRAAMEAALQPRSTKIEGAGE